MNDFVTRKRFGDIVTNSFKKEFDKITESKKIPGKIISGEIQSSYQIDEPMAIYALYSYLEDIGGDKNIVNILVGAITRETNRQKGIAHGLQNKINEYKNYW